jgi:predicted DCC family thiol-disulfide oxidoreductase YuxK
MKTSSSKAIVYDSTCPMCALYTKGFVKWGMLEPDNRIAFAQLEADTLPFPMDLHRSKHEIPLVDLQGGETLYGLDALVFLLDQKIPFIKRTVQLPPVNTFFRWLYHLVSYNRRVIIPSTPSQQGLDCTPDFHKSYRQQFIGLAILVSVLITWLFGESVAKYLPPTSFGLKMVLIAGTGWVVQMGIASLYLKGQQRINYWGHLGVIMILGVLVLLPGIWLGNLTGHTSLLIPLTSVLLSSSLMLWQHQVRIKHLQLSQAWTLSWFLVLQSTAILWLIIFF